MNIYKDILNKTNDISDLIKKGDKRCVLRLKCTQKSVSPMKSNLFFHIFAVI